MNQTIQSISSCKSIPGIDMRSVMLTPYVAEKLLKANTHNRKISASVVQRYVNEINNDEWMLSAQGIGFDRDGILCDGQHRLQAIFDSGKTVPMLIVYGLAPRSQEKVDRQRKRSLFDVFYLAGYAERKKDVQIAMFIAIMNTGNVWGAAASVPDSEVKNCLNCHRDAINSIVGGWDKNVRGIGRIGFLSACVLFYEIDAKKALLFLNQVKTGTMLTLDDPAMRLRKYLLSEAGYVKSTVKHSGGLGRIDFKKSIFAINAFLEGRKITALKESDKIQNGAQESEEAA
jgi:hypothetical protein